MEQQRLPDRRRRNRNFDETHALLIEKAIELISALGTEALSISALARESGINRSTVYYHFDSRETLIDAVQAWSSNQIAEGFSAAGRGDSTVTDAIRFVLANPEVMKLWIDELVSDGEIRSRYPLWDVFVDLVSANGVPHQGDSEVLSITLLVGCIVGARVYRHSIRPDLPLEEAIARIASVHGPLLRQFGVV